MGIKFDDWAWWNGDYDYYKQLTITPNIYDVYNGTTINLTMDTATLISAGKMQNDCDDLRIVYNDEIELDRVLGDYDFLTDDGCNDISTNIFFQTIKKYNWH